MEARCILSRVDLIMFEKIYVHIGLPKTGTSYIQSCMEALSRDGVLESIAYPVQGGSKEFHSIQSGNGQVIAETLDSGITPLFDFSKLETAISELLQACVEPRRALLISSEVFWSAEPERFSVFKKLLLKHADAVELIACARPIEELCHSSYHQLVKRAGCSLQYGGDFFHIFCDDLFARLKTLDVYFSEGQVLLYKKQGLLEDFLQILGEERYLAGRFQNQTVNRSLTQEEINLLTRINAVFHSEPLSAMISDRWIYARPEVPSVDLNGDDVHLFSIFNGMLQSAGFTFESVPVRRIIDVLLRGAVKRSEAEYQDNMLLLSQQSGGQAEYAGELLVLALDEIKKFLVSGERIKQYAAGLQPTKEAFDPVHYLLLNRDVLDAGIDPILHYQGFGRSEGRFSAYNWTSLLLANS